MKSNARYIRSESAKVGKFSVSKTQLEVHRLSEQEANGKQAIEVVKPQQFQHRNIGTSRRVQLQPSAWSFQA